jgi:hypothetical protein
MANKSLWPWTVDSKIVDTAIDWANVSDEAYKDTCRRTWNKVKPVDLTRLLTDVRYAAKRELLPVAIRDHLLGEPPAPPPSLTKRKSADDILEMIEAEIRTAQASDDVGAALKGIELLGKAQALFSVKEVDPTIVINVITNVNRGSP